jgi:hypothetical protein
MMWEGPLYIVVNFVMMLILQICNAEPYEMDI